MNKQCLIRILVYEGPSKAIETVLRQRGVKGSFYIAGQDLLIREAIVSDFLETLDKPAFMVKESK